MAAELLDEKYAVSLVTSGDAALKVLQKGMEPDIILLDIDMQHMDGYETIKQIKRIEEMKQIPVVFLTGLTEAANEIRGLELGAVDYIRKPFVKEVLMSRVAVHLENGRRLRERNTLDEEKLKDLQEALMETELKVARLMAMAYTNEEIAQELNYSVAYVKKVVSRVLRKLGINNRREIKLFLK